MESKKKIKYGSLEIDYEGSESFLKQELPELLKTVSGMFYTQEVSTQALNSESSTEVEEQIPTSTPNTQKIEGTTNTIAAKLRVNSGPELILAAAAHLTFVKQQDKFHRKELLDAMQTASTFYKKTFSNNLSASIDRLVKSNQLTEQARDVYAIPADTRLRLEGMLVK